MTEKVVLVNDRDEEIGLMDKLEAHEKGLLHRAVSVVLFQEEDPRMVLLQQRAAGKYHSPLMWANACCSHPRRGETPAAAARRRVREELAIDAPQLRFADTYAYRAQVGGLVEHEITHVFYGFLPKAAPVPLNPEEVAAVEWVDMDALTRGKDCAPWMRSVIETALAGLRQRTSP